MTKLYSARHHAALIGSTLTYFARLYFTLLHGALFNTTAHYIALRKSDSSIRYSALLDFTARRYALQRVTVLHVKGKSKTLLDTAVLHMTPRY